ncbi:hypothetical protein [Microbacterium sp. SA39]|uniref:hypothetical protein n=1 Tax=Microbacterium sp. SA39 TaxID=1263625 RepID=UPI001F48D6F5|nr:hypothetical protein [Microbacterium sp. SA39]
MSERSETKRVNSELSKPDDDYGDLGEPRNRRIRIIAWTVIVALILGGGGATVLTILLG